MYENVSPSKGPVMLVQPGLLPGPPSAALLAVKLSHIDR